MRLYSRDAPAALTIERYNVNNARIAGHGEGSKKLRSSRCPLRLKPTSALRQTRSTTVGHAVVNPCRPRECVRQILSYVREEV